MFAFDLWQALIQLVNFEEERKNSKTYGLSLFFTMLTLCCMLTTKYKLK